jgi:glutaredoxin
MGRVTVFSLSDCSHCKRTKAALTEHGISFTEISLSSHPEKRSDMLSLADKLTVPQVFFNDEHIGGADDTLALLNEWGANAKDRFQKEVESKPDPTDPRLALPTSPPVVEKPAPPRDQEKSIRLPGGSMVTVLEIMNTLKSILPRQTLKYNLTIYKNAFKGTDAVKALMKEYSLQTPEEAVKFGVYLQESSILHHVVKEHVFCNKKKFFRLQCYQQPDILNSFRIWTERVDDEPMNLLQRLKKLLGSIESAVTNDKGLVDYKNAYKHELFSTFEEAVCELQGINMGKMDDRTRLAFGINLYNLMIKYAFMKVGIGSTTLARGTFFSHVKFNVGGDILSFNDLENGVLRGNAAPPYSFFAPFSKTDPRRRLALDKADCRIHFALNCGAKSCPPVKNFTASAVNEELRIVAQAFAEQEDNVRLVPEKNEIYLNKILSWYGIDFASSKDLLPEKVVTFLRGEKKQSLQVMIDSGKKISVYFNEYDWSTNASDYVLFDSAVLKADIMTVKALLG